MYNIRELDDSFHGIEHTFAYETTQYLDFHFHVQDGNYTFELKLKTFTDGPVHKSFTTTFGKSFLESPVLFGMMDGETICGFLELSVENWSNRTRVANIFIHPAYRKKGLGKCLMEQALMVAKKQNSRALVLETQSCNIPAIQLYRSCGLDIIGFDTTHYSNTDIEKKEFRVEMGIII